MIFVEVAFGTSTKTTLAAFVGLACLDLVKCIGYTPKYSIQILSNVATTLIILSKRNSGRVGAWQIDFVAEHASFQAMGGFFDELGKTVVG